MKVIDRRDLLYMITWREIKVKYKQTVTGPGKAPSLSGWNPVSGTSAEILIGCENIYLNGANLGRSKQETRRRFGAIAATLAMSAGVLGARILVTEDLPPVIALGSLSLVWAGIHGGLMARFQNPRRCVRTGPWPWGSDYKPDKGVPRPHLSLRVLAA